MKDSTRFSRLTEIMEAPMQQAAVWCAMGTLEPEDLDAAYNIACVTAFAIKECAATDEFDHEGLSKLLMDFGLELSETLSVVGEIRTTAAAL